MRGLRSIVVMNFVVCGGALCVVGCDAAGDEAVATLGGDQAAGSDSRDYRVVDDDSVQEPGSTEPQVDAPPTAEPAPVPTPVPEGDAPVPEPEPEPETPDVVGSGAHGACPDFSSFGEMPSCCEGTGSCVPADALPPGLQSQVSPCSDAGRLCVPDGIIDSIQHEGGFWPRVCDSIGGEPGVCLSTCIPKVGQFASLLPQDVCGASERCAPCIDPLTGEDSGACGDGLDCFAGVDPEDEPTEPVQPDEPEEPVVVAEPIGCDNLPTEPVVDPETFPSCGTAAHCVPALLVDQDDQENLAECDSGFCVPDPMIASGGYFIPETCTSLNGVEGRCLNTVLPAVGVLADSLPVDVCADHERCSPCCDPMTGDSSGVCDQGCDEGPAEGCTGEPLYTACCGGVGHCIDADLVPDDLESSLAECKGDDKGAYCVPDAMQDPDYAGEACLGDSILWGEYDGVCLPSCLDIFLEITFDKSPCAGEHMCVPCADPILGAPTGAPGCAQ